MFYQGPVPQLVLSGLFPAGANRTGRETSPCRVFLKHPTVTPVPSLESVHCRVTLVTYTQMSGPHTPVSLACVQ